MLGEQCEGPDAGVTERAVLALMIDSYPAIWTAAELARVIAGQPLHEPGSEPPQASITDALRELYGAGLVHSISGAFYFVSRAGIESYRRLDDDPIST